MTGEESKLFMCNSNLSAAMDVWYWNYYDYFKDEEARTEKFSYENRIETWTQLTYYINTTLKWPYNVIYNCYWSLDDLYLGFQDEDLPYLFPIFDSEGHERDLYLHEQIITNVLFNLGFMVQDTIWLVNLGEDETNYWYRVGFVSGDIYGRFYYRSLYDLSVK